MKAKVTRAFVKTMNENPDIKAAGITLHYVTLDTLYYQVHVSPNICYTDIDYNDKIKAVKITYPDNYYAMPVYITTDDIRKCAISADSYNMNDFVKEFIDRYEI